ncbi:hypothetical protein V2J46_04095 [Staphylococcus saccharolyticus]
MTQAQAIENAKTLNDAMKALNKLYNKKTKVLNSSQFVNEDQSEKDAYQQAINHVESVIHGQTNPEMEPIVINNLTHELETAQNNLHGDQKLAHAQQDAANTINGLTHLNTAQRDTIINKNANATTREQVAKNLNNAQALDKAMEDHENVVANKNNVLNSGNYLNEDTKYQQPYNQRMADAEQLINQTTDPTLKPYQVEIIKNRVISCKKELPGVEKLASDKAQAKFGITDMKNLNDAQKQSFIQTIDNAPLRTKVKQLLQQAKKLDEAMKSLKDKTQVVITNNTLPNYTESSDDKKEAVDQAVSHTQAMIDKVNGSNASLEQVQQAVDQLSQAAENLNGNQRVTEAKTDANQTIDQLAHLNSLQQQTAKESVENATKLDEIVTTKANAQALNKVMGQLKQFINHADSVENSDNYRQADDNNVTAYDEALEHAKDIQKTNATQIQVEQAIHQLSHAETNLNGFAKLNTARPKALEYINSLDKINNAQKAALENKVNQSHDLIELKHLVDEGTNLNDTMHALSKAIVDNFTPTQASINYINADSQLKDNFNQAINNSRNVLNKTQGQNLDFDTVGVLKDAISQTKEALNGIERLKAAKAKADKFIESLNSLNKAQLTHALKEITNVDSLTQLARLVNKAIDLDDAMQSLKSVLAHNTASVQASSNFINADENLKEQFEHALNSVRNALAKATGKKLSETQIEGLKQTIIDTKEALNGEQRLSEAKAKALKYVQTLTHLNDAQRKVAENEINLSEDLTSLAASTSTVTELDEAMKDLREALIINSTPVHSSVNYINTDEDLQSQFDNALQQARNQLAQSTGEPINTDEVQALIRTINDTKNALNDSERLANAKTKAENLLNKFKDLNNAQRDDSINQIKVTDNLQDLAQIISTATDLNDAMKELRDKLKSTVNPVKASIKYVNADYDLRRQFNKAVKDAREALSKTEGENLNIRDIQSLSQVIVETKDALNGTQRLNGAKSKANQFIKQLDQLNDAQESAIKQQIDDSDNIKDITNLVNNGLDLNDAMNNLKELSTAWFEVALSIFKWASFSSCSTSFIASVLDSSVAFALLISSSCCISALSIAL